MSAAWVYLLRCSDGSLYTGWTNRLDARFAAHQRGKGAKYTRARRPVELVYWEGCPDRRSALRREYAIKQLTRAQKLALIAQRPELQQEGFFMTNRYRNITELVGKTPLMELRRYQQAHKLSAVLLAKLEYLNPTGSVKDRAALGMIEDAERRGLLAAGGVIIEPTSGNTGIGLAMLAAARGYQAIFTMPETMSIERRRLLAAYGAKVVLTEGAKGMAGAIAKAKELAAELPGAFLAGQFENPANPAAHYAATGPEIWRDTQGEVEAFVAGVGTGGTISGVGRYLKEQKPAVRVVAVEPEASPVLSGGKPGPHRLQGIGAGFVPQNFDAAACDEILPVAEQDAFAACRELARLEGLLVGATSGAAVHAAAQLARRQEFRGKVIVALLPDTGARYLSTDLFGQEEG